LRLYQGQCKQHTILPEGAELYQIQCWRWSDSVVVFWSGQAELFGRGKLVMLRTCNQLLRCLSKANDVVFCGRILMFLAHFFPLSERSAVNIKGVCNVSNETKYEKEPPKDGLLIDFNFYKTFWSLQVSRKLADKMQHWTLKLA
jgi:hypothetical protein